MGQWESPIGGSDEWYTPAYIFDALGVTFDLDVAGGKRETHVPCRNRIISNSLELKWVGFIWMNPPFGGRNGILPWVDRFIEHGNGIALAPDRTSAPWFQHFANYCDRVLFLSPKVRFERPDGSLGMQPGNGTALFGIGNRACEALSNASHLGWLVQGVICDSLKG